MNAQPDRLFIARLEDMLGQCGRYSAPVFSSFLDERQCAETEIWLRANAGDCGYLLWGGYPDARRKMLAVFPEYLRGGITELFPMKCLTFAYRKEDTLTHRDILGSLMAIAKIGRVGVKTDDSRPFELENAQKFQDISGTVASLRLDCIVSLAAKLSREKAAALIRTDKVDVNHLTADSLSYELKEGDILSVRGCGRFILSGINGETKKGRIHIILKKYI